MFISNRETDRENIMSLEVIKVDIDSISGFKPGYELVEFELGSDPIESGFCILGFDEIGMGEFKNPQYAFIGRPVAEYATGRE